MGYQTNVPEADIKNKMGGKKRIKTNEYKIKIQMGVEKVARILDSYIEQALILEFAYRQSGSESWSSHKDQGQRRLT